MKLKQVIVKTRVPNYKSALWIVVSNNFSKTFDLLEDELDVVVHNQEGRNSTRAYTFAYVRENGAKLFMLFFKPGSTHGEIAHETKHVVNLIFLWHGVKLNASNDEAECYFLENVTDKVYNTFKKYKKLYSPVKKSKINIEENLTSIV